LAFLLAAEVVAATAAVSEGALVYVARHRNLLISLFMLSTQALLTGNATVEGMVALRRDFHRHPELSFTEQRTSQIIAERLTRAGLEVKTGIAKTGVVGLLRGDKPGKTIAWRADIDALPLTETLQAPFASGTPSITERRACAAPSRPIDSYGTSSLELGLAANLLSVSSCRTASSSGVGAPALMALLKPANSLQVWDGSVHRKPLVPHQCCGPAILIVGFDG